VTDWRPISTYDKSGLHVGWSILFNESDRWIRFGWYFPECKAWYYSGTNERAQFSSVRGDDPTHWMPIPEPPPMDSTARPFLWR
jgi:Protein of unknown function (DUF551)